MSRISPPTVLSILAFASAVLSTGAAFAAGESAAQLGAPAPEFTLTDQSGKTVSLSSFAGKVVVLEWTNPDCPFVVRHYKANTMTSLAEKYAPHGVAWLAVNSSHNAGAQANSKFFLSSYYVVLSTLIQHEIEVHPKMQHCSLFNSKGGP